MSIWETAKGQMTEDKLVRAVKLENQLELVTQGVRVGVRQEMLVLLSQGVLESELYLGTVQCLMERDGGKQQSEQKYQPKKFLQKPGFR